MREFRGELHSIVRKHNCQSMSHEDIIVARCRSEGLNHGNKYSYTDRQILMKMIQGVARLKIIVDRWSH